jgi:hypothetical protein
LLKIMAEKTIGIKIQLNGINAVVKDIETFERILKEAKEDLKQIPIGEKNFKDLTKEIANAEGQLRNLTEAQRGLTSEKASEGLSKFGSGIASSFAAATAAVGLFGKESEDVSKVAADAQNLLTLALSIRGLAEIKTGAAIVAKTIVEKASAAATVATTNATRTLYTTLAANPYTAIIALLGALVTAFIAFGSEEEETTEKTKTLTEVMLESTAAIQGQIIQIRTLQTILNDSNSTLNQQAGAYAQLQKLIPELSKLTLEQARSQGVLNRAIEDEINLINLRAEQKAYEEYLTQLKKEEIQQQALIRRREQVKVQLKELKDAQELYTRAVAGGFAGTFEEFQKQGEAFGGLGAAIGQTASSAKQLTFEEKELLRLGREIAEIEGRRKIASDAAAESTKNADAQAKKALDTQKKLIELYQQKVDLQLELLKQASATYKELSQTPTVDLTPPEVIANLDKFVKTREALKDRTISDVFKELGIEIKIVNNEIRRLGDSLEEEIDPFGKFYQQASLEINSFIKNLDASTDDVNRVINGYIDEANRLFKLGPEQGGITKEAQDVFLQVANEYKKLAKIVRDEPLVEQSDLEILIELQKQIGILTGNITVVYNETTGEIIQAGTAVKSLSDTLNDQQNIIKEIEKDLSSKLFKQVSENFDNFKKNVETELKGVPSATAESIKESLSQIDISTEEGLKKLKELTDEIAKYRTDAISNTAKYLIEQQAAILKFFADAQKAAKEGRALESVSLKNSLLNNTDLVIKFTQQANKIVIDEKKLQADQLKSLEEQLALKGIDIAKFTEEEKLKILKAYLAKQKEEKDAAAAEDEKRGKITLETVSKTLGQVSSLIGRLSSLTSQFYAFQLQKLQTENEKALTNVVGDTEEANTKRLELEQQYQTQKAYIEKQATIKALQFQLAQAIVDGAQAVIAVAEIPPLAIATGILVAGQILLIRQQLAYAQSLAGGGKIRMGAGGMVVGPSHEMGGVSYPMGVNLEGGETVINRTSSANYSGLLSSINQAGGGQPIISNATNSLMEERLIQAISKTRSTPIRAYVLEQDISRSQTIQRKLDQLATI